MRGWPRPPPTADLRRPAAPAPRGGPNRAHGDEVRAAYPGSHSGAASPCPHSCEEDASRCTAPSTLPRVPSPHPLPLRAAAVLGGLLLTGCGSGAATDPGSQADLRAGLPKAVKAAGVLRIGSYLNYPPVDFRDGDGKPTGLDPEIAAVADHLGLRVEFTDLPFGPLARSPRSRPGGRY
ncbi:transporter substrate-binding domain-containing protein [Kitasatospora sp. NPDC001660]